jgi:hypothetical protein
VSAAIFVNGLSQGSVDMKSSSAESRQQLQQMLMGFRHTQLLHVAAKLGIADLLASRSRSADELAQLCECIPSALYRVLRALSTLGVVNELPERCFELTDLGGHLRSDHAGSLRDLATYYGEPWTWNAYGSLLRTVRTGETAFEAVHGKPFFSYLNEHPSAASVFNNAMTSLSEQEAQTLLAAYDFSRFAVIADIAGGHGRLLAAILIAHPDSRGLLFDLPDVADRAHEIFAQTTVTERASIVAGSFFDDALPPRADLYLLKSIIHDWEDVQARAILRRCREAMSTNSRLLVIERVIGEPGERTEAKMFDLNMLVMCGGRERTEQEHRELMASAGLRLDRTISTAGALSLLEATTMQG